MFGASNPSASAAPSSGGLFGSAKPQNSGNIFGSSSTTSGGLFGASTTTSTPQTTGNLFGSSTSAATTPQTGLFGSTNQQATGQQTGSNLFGASSQNTTSTNLFGSNNNATGGGTGNLFGSTQGNSTPTGLFGSSNLQNAGQQSGSNLFGSSNQNTPSTNLFGSTNNNLNTSGVGNLFGGNQGNSAPLGNSFGTKASSVPVTPAPSVSQSNPVFTRTTRFNDLPEDAKKQLETLDAMIQTQCRHSDTLKAMQLGTEITEGTSLLRQVTSEMHATSASVKTSSNLLDSIRQSIDGDVADLLNLAAIVDAHHSQRMAVGSHNAAESLPNPMKFQFEFFSQKAADMEERVKRYRQTIDYVELQLKGLFDRPSPASIVPALKAQYSTFMVLADKVAQLDTAVRNLKEEYRDIWRHQTGSVRDPFAEIDQAFGLGSSTATFQAG
ncbi:uncharacterized protein PGTG_17151 [Puccinia graminis f. sp. tritici CRL 75-36-700-3]|uniref:Uncharacterized protein n=1 Tax=Puccinia graminis f. sp. tritici (strain CRL 75-36-700-3 / race SCCL) TaxID=418459 RepID=E3L419_PUCGT|nr:uncharacterized protein PGTG_17151 [Puccinia graminis f. sp. tritici CRL 75-36-700-3]EFP91294.2 hypothetical protein PGTG_17151 [Puccinia graminis f. sp. tritici CRL 75-36-700-3]